MEWNRNQRKMGIKNLTRKEQIKWRTENQKENLKQKTKKKRVQVQSSLDWINVCRRCCYCFYSGQRYSHWPKRMVGNAVR